MANSISVTGLDEIVVQLDKATSRMLPEVSAVLGKAGLAIKKGAQQRWGGLGHAPALPYAVSYDVSYGLGGVSVEVGPDKSRRQGALGNLLEFGSINNAPRPALAPELDLEAAKTVTYLDALLVKLLG